MAFGLGGLRLQPDAFWLLSIPELIAIASAVGRGLSQGTPMAPGDLAALIARYPDQPPRKEEQSHDR